MKLILAVLALALPLAASALDGVECRDLLNFELSEEVGKPGWKFAEPHYVILYHAILYGSAVPVTGEGD